MSIDEPETSKKFDPYGATVEVAGMPHLVARQRTDKWFLAPAPTLPPDAPEDEP